MFWVSSWESFALFSTDNRFEISVSISLLVQNLPLLVERVSLCSLQIIALKLVCRFCYCYKICPCYIKVLLWCPCLRTSKENIHEYNSQFGCVKYLIISYLFQFDVFVVWTAPRHPRVQITEVNSFLHQSVHILSSAPFGALLRLSWTQSQQRLVSVFHCCPGHVYIWYTTGCPG